MENMTEEHKKNILDLFVEGARKGFTIGTTSLLPNVIMAFVIIRIFGRNRAAPFDRRGLSAYYGTVGTSRRSSHCDYRFSHEHGRSHWYLNELIHAGHYGSYPGHCDGSRYLSDGKPCSKCGTLPRHFRCEQSPLFCDHYDLLNKHPAIHLGYAFNHALLLNVVEQNCDRRTDLLWKIQNHFLNF